MTKRNAIPIKLRQDVLIEAGFRCGVPTCRNLLAIDLHHIVEVSEGGSNSLSNLIALCPTCHALFHRGTITRDAIYAWKGILVALNQAFDVSTVDQLLFLDKVSPGELHLSGDGVLHFYRLIAADLAKYQTLNWKEPVYEVVLTEKGKNLVAAWKSGNRDAISIALTASQ